MGMSIAFLAPFLPLFGHKAPQLIFHVTAYFFPNPVSAHNNHVFILGCSANYVGGYLVLGQFIDKVLTIRNCNQHGTGRKEGHGIKAKLCRDSVR